MLTAVLSFTAGQKSFAQQKQDDSLDTIVVVKKAATELLTASEIALKEAKAYLKYQKRILKDVERNKKKYPSGDFSIINAGTTIGLPLNGTEAKISLKRAELIISKIEQYFYLEKYPGKKVKETKKIIIELKEVVKETGGILREIESLTS